MRSPRLDIARDTSAGPYFSCFKMTNATAIAAAPRRVNSQSPCGEREINLKIKRKKVPLLLFIGGFLGAGKTTAISSLAKMLTKGSGKVAAIINDHAAGLVDTLFLSGNGIAVTEIAGSRFCCNFGGLAEAISAEIESENPDFILAEPVGSCIDIVATVVRPMMAMMSDKLAVAAFSVLVDPRRWQELAGNQDDLSMKFIFDRQLEEADCIVVTKADALSDSELQIIVEQVASRYPSPMILPISAVKNAGLSEWMDFVRATPPQERWLRRVDYRRYADAEAEISWLNAKVSTEYFDPVDGVEAATALLEMLLAEVETARARIVHLKILADSEKGFIKAGTTQTSSRFDMDGGFGGPVEKLEFTINIRAIIDPPELSKILQTAVNSSFFSEKARNSILYLHTFSPAAPNPTYRFDTGRQLVGYSKI